MLKIARIQYRKMSVQAARLLVSPARALVDERVDITVESLFPRQPVTLQAQLVEGAARFQSFAHYMADSAGRVVLGKQSALGGTYTGIDQMGLFWSLQPSPGQKTGLRLRKKDVSTPFLVNLSLHNGHVDVTGEEEENLPDCLAATTVERWYMGEGVERIPVREGRVRGTLFLPPAKGPFAGVLDLFGSTGGLAEYRAALLASRGFAVLALAFLAYEDLPKEINDIDLDYFEEVVDWLLSLSNVQSHGVGILSTSKGGEIALSIASHMGNKCFQVEKADCPIMFVAGEDDLIVKAVFFANQVIARMKAHGKTNYTLLRYPGTGHLIEPPYTPHCGLFYHGVFRWFMLAGGEPKSHAAAQEDSWHKILHFFRTHVDRSRPQSQL
ncbi:acyl-coenzyme A amino acid N-acyltransferase 1-like [Branchiostoma floridae x Branchiostoma belcheri]